MNFKSVHGIMTYRAAVWGSRNDSVGFQEVNAYLQYCTFSCSTHTPSPPFAKGGDGGISQRTVLIRVYQCCVVRFSHHLGPEKVLFMQHIIPQTITGRLVEPVNPHAHRFPNEARAGTVPGLGDLQKCVGILILRARGSCGCRVSVQGCQDGEGVRC